MKYEFPILTQDEIDAYSNNLFLRTATETTSAGHAGRDADWIISSQIGNVQTGRMFRFEAWRGTCEGWAMEEYRFSGYCVWAPDSSALLRGMAYVDA